MVILGCLSKQFGIRKRSQRQKTVCRTIEEAYKSQFTEVSIMIHLEKLTYENFDDVFELKVKKVQYPFV